MLGESLVDLEVCVGDGEYHVNGVLLDLEVDLRDARVVLLRRVRVHAVVVEVASTVVGLHDASKLTEKLIYVLFSFIFNLQTSSVTGG